LSFRQRSYFLLRRGSPCHSDKKTFVLSIKRDSSVAKSSFRMTGRVLSFRQRSSFCFDEESICHSERNRFFSCEKLLQNDRQRLSFRERSYFLLRRGIFLCLYELLNPKSEVKFQILIHKKCR